MKRFDKFIGRSALAAGLSLVLALASPVSALAEHFDGESGWTVTYTTDGKLTDNYGSGTYFDAVSNLQPGDDITFTIQLVHSNDNAADWYMANEVIESLEDSDASGSAYDYLLTYTNSNGTTAELYRSSEKVGGDNSDGLEDVNSELADYFFLEHLSKGSSGTVTLNVSLDGETEGNTYFETVADIVMRFAVEPDPEPTTRVERKTENRVVNTGDETSTRLFPFYVAMVVSGVLFLALGVQSVRLRRQDREEGLR